MVEYSTIGGICINITTLNALKKLYSASQQKVIITDSSLKILWTSLSLEADTLSKEMFSTNNVVLDYSSIFPVLQEKRVYLKLSGVGYTALITPILDEDALVILLSDSIDAIKSGLFSGSMASLQNAFSQIRQASAEIFSLSKLLSEDPDIPEDKLPIVSRIGNQCQRLLAVQSNQDEVLYYANGEHADAVFDIAAFTKDICYLCTSFLRCLNVEVSCEANDVIAVECDCDRYMIVLLNLIENSLMYNLSDVKKVSVSVKALDDKACISITDNGVGLSAEKIELMSIPFGSCELGSGKSGIGFFALGQFIKAYSGNLTISTSSGEGTGIHIRLPISDKSISSLRSPIDSMFSSLLSPITIRLSRLINK